MKLLFFDVLMNGKEQNSFDDEDIMCKKEQLNDNEKKMQEQEQYSQRKRLVRFSEKEDEIVYKNNHHDEVIEKIDNDNYDNSDACSDSTDKKEGEKQEATTTTTTTTTWLGRNDYMKITENAYHTAKEGIREGYHNILQYAFQHPDGTSYGQKRLLNALLLEELFDTSSISSSSSLSCYSSSSSCCSTNTSTNTNNKDSLRGLEMILCKEYAIKSMKLRKLKMKSILNLQSKLRDQGASVSEIWEQLYHQSKQHSKESEEFVKFANILGKVDEQNVNVFISNKIR